jgi:hypothetical protein
MRDEHLALFVMLGQTAARTASDMPMLVPPESLLLSRAYDLAAIVPERVRDASRAAITYKLLFVFEGYLRDFVADVLSKDPVTSWWDKVPKDVQDEITKLSETEEAKSWMALGSRDKSALMTYPQLIRVIDYCWKLGFEDLVRDKTLLQQARLIGHLRNTICHMTSLPDEETERIRQTMRDWFRIIAP